MAGGDENLPHISVDESGEEQTNNTDDQAANSSYKQGDASSATENQEKLIKLPLSRIRGIIKSDPDVRIASQDAVITIAKAAELFIQGLAQEAAGRTLREKRKTVLRKHLDGVLDTKDCYSFLEGVLESFED